MAETRTLVLFGILGTTILAGVGVSFFVAKPYFDGAKPASHSPSATREDRLRPAGYVAEAPVPTAMPLAGEVGVDANGYPKQYVDQAGFRALLKAREFGRLTDYVESLQSQFEADWKKEYWITDAVQSFSSSEAELGTLLSEWVAATPGSFAPYLCRADHLVAVGWDSRGGKFANSTAKEDFDAMQAALDKAREDIKTALEKKPNLVVALRLKMRTNHGVRKVSACKHVGSKVGPIQLMTWKCAPTDSGDTRALDVDMDEIIKICPNCLMPRVTYIDAIRPRWGGSFQQMDAFANASAKLPNPRLLVLGGFSHLDKAQQAQWDTPKLDLALNEVNEALAIGEYWTFFQERSVIYQKQEKFDLAIADLDRAIALRGPVAELLFHRAKLLVKLKRFEESAKDILAGLRVDPTPGQQVPIYLVTQGLVAQATELRTQGNAVEALRLLDLANAIGPGNNAIDNLRISIVEAEAEKASAGDPDAFEKRVMSKPHDFELHLQLDALWSKTAEWERIAAMWTVFIADNPNEGRAYQERGGTYSHLRRLKDAYNDAKRACELGVSEGCAWAEALRTHI